MKATITGQDFITAARQTANKIARFYRPDPNMEIGKIGVVMHGSTGACAHAWIKSSGRRRLQAVIAFPAIGLGASLTRAEADLWIGYMIHELGHAFGTDEREWQNFCATHTSVENKILNGLEDARMERDTAAKLTPNARRVLRKLNRTMLERTLARGYQPGHMVQLPYTLAVLGRWRLLGFEDATCRKLLASMPEDRRAWMVTVLDRLERCTNTADCARLAVDVYREALDKAFATKGQDMEGPSTPPPPPGEEGQSKEGDDWTENKGGAGDDGLRAPKDDEADEGEADEGEADEGEADEGEDASGEGAAGGEADEGEGHEEAEPDTGEEDDALDVDAPRAPSAHEDDISSDMGRVRSPEPDLADSAAAINARAGRGGLFHYGGVRIAEEAFSEREHAHAEPGYRAFRDRVAHGLGKSRLLLKQLLTSPERVGWHTYERHGRLTSRDVGRAGAGEASVFSKRWRIEGVDTACMVVIDGSSSMYGSGITAARDMALAVTLALEAARMPVQVAVFCDGYEAQHYPNKKEKLVQLHGLNRDHISTEQRLADNGAAAKLKIVKPWHTRTDDIAAAWNMMEHMPTGGTPDFPALVGAIEIMRKRREARRVVFMVTDGQGQVEALRWAAREYAQRHNVDVIGLGIGHNVRDQYPVAVTVARHQAMNGKLASAAISELLKSARKSAALRKAG